jgi:hypothetical protein
MIKKLLGMTLLLGSLSLSASEVDSFTHRDEMLQMENSLPKLNKFVQDRLKYAVDMANKKRRCKVKRLKKEVLKALSSTQPMYYPTGPLFIPEQSYGVHGYLETAVDIGTDPTGQYAFEVRGTNRKLSIFRDLTLAESPPVHKVVGKLVRVQYKRNGKIFNLAIGSDKFGHWISQGYEYHKKTKEDYKNRLHKALRHGEFIEATVLGLVTSGFYSYGDLAANLMGMVFWDHLIDEDQNAAGRRNNLLSILRPKGPYIKCKNDRWMINKNHTFDFLDYISSSWDEAINFPVLYNRKMMDKIKRRIIEVQEKKDTNLTPPMEVFYCDESIKFFQKKFPGNHRAVVRSVINPMCRTAYVERKTETWSEDNWFVPGEVEKYKNSMRFGDKYVPKAPNEELLRDKGI